MSTDPTTQRATPSSVPFDSPGEKGNQDNNSLKESGAISLSSDASSNPTEISFTEAEDRAVRRKLDVIVMPILFLGFYVFQVGSS